jgi:hypothetical protein
MIARAGAGDVKQVPLGIIDLLQIGVVAYRLDALLQRNNLVVTGHYDHSPELETFGKVHSANRDVAAGGFDMLVENLECDASLLDGRPRTIQLSSGLDKHPEFVRKYPILSPSRDPFADGLNLIAFIFERANRRRRTVEHRDSIAPVLAVTVNIGHDRAEQTIRPRPNLVGSAIIDAQGAGASPDVHALGFPRKGLLKDALAQVAREKQGIGPASAQGGNETADERH